jgi:hypothetical protein
MIQGFFRLHDVDRSNCAYDKKTKRRSSEEEESTTTSNGSDSLVGGTGTKPAAVCGGTTGCRRRWGRATAPPPPPPPDIGLAIRQAVSVVSKVRAASAVSPTTYDMLKEEIKKNQDVPDKYNTKAVEDLTRPRPQEEAAGGDIPACCTHLPPIDESDSEDDEDS